MAKRGGARPGAGRPKGSKSLRSIAGREFALEILAQNNIAELFDELLSSQDLKIRLEAAKFLIDHAYGRAAQSIDQTVSNKDGSPVNQGIKIVAVMPSNEEREIGPPVENGENKNKVHKVM